MSDTDRRDEDEMLAAEFALRLLDGDEMAKAHERVLSDSGFASRVAAWDMRLAAFADEVAPEQPSVAAKQALMERMFAHKASAPIWSRVSVWRAMTFASLALAAVLGFFLAGVVQQPASVQATQIASQQGDFRAIVVLDRTLGELHLTRVAGHAPPGRVLQFWAHGPDQPAMSVGLIPDAPAARFPVPDFLDLAQAPLTFGISEEPPGGSPTGRPSGRVFGTADIGE